MMLDTYTTFGCRSGEPTFRYSLLDGVKDGFLINPFVYDARTDITTELLSEEGIFLKALMKMAMMSKRHLLRKILKRSFSLRRQIENSVKPFYRTQEKILTQER